MRYDPFLYKSSPQLHPHILGFPLSRVKATHYAVNDDVLTWRPLAGVGLKLGIATPGATMI